MVEAARNGLFLWAQQLVPSLFPFMILSNLSSAYLYRSFSILPPFLSKISKQLLGVSLYGSYIFFIGQLCGYPIGAKLVGTAYQNGTISESEANYLLTISNQSSPAFLEFYVGKYILNSQLSTLHLFFIFYCSTFITSMITRLLYRPTPTSHSLYQMTPEKQPAFFELLDKSIRDSSITILHIGGYIMLFSIFSSILRPLCAYIKHTSYIFLALLEITNGLSLIKEKLYYTTLFLPVTIVITATGGICTMAQIKGMLLGTFLSIKPYLVGKTIYTCVVLLLFLFSKINFFFSF